MGGDRPRRVLILCSTLLLLGTSGDLGAQTTSRQNRDAQREDMSRLLEEASPEMVQPKREAYESTVKPEEYIVGPSDVIGINVWGSTALNYSLTVSPEGTLLIPLVGAVDVADITLAEAKQRVSAEVRKKYIVGEVSVTLLLPRRVVVMVTGSVAYPGLYTLSAMDRAHKAVEEANKPISPEPRVAYKKTLLEMSQRNIRLTHKDGSQSRVDLDMFFATHENRWNPFLREGDVINVPPKDQARSFVAAYGEVTAPGAYEYVAGDSLNDLLEIAHGLTAYADRDSVFLYRLSLDGDSLHIRHIDLRAVKEGSSADIPLEPGDRLVVRPLRDFRRDYTVAVLGEVVYPGVYPIARSGVRLTAAVAMAGGFTEHAMISGAFVKRKAGSRGFVVDSLMSLRGRNAQEDYGYYTVEAALLTQHHNVRVNFEDVFRRGDSTQNVLLVPGDTVYVPTRTRSVYVFGQVVRPGYVPFVAGWTADDYVAQSGGYNEAALKGDIRIVKVRTGQWVAEDATSIEEGDYVWVPKDPERGFGYYLGVVAQSAAIISVAISTVVIVSQIGK